MLSVKDFFKEPFSLDTRKCPFYNQSFTMKKMMAGEGYG